MAAKPHVGTSDLVDSLVELSFAVQDVLARAAADYDLSVTQLRLLGILRDRTPAMTAIADHLGLDRSSVTGLVDRAQRRGLVSRTTSTHDARVTIVTVTSRGLTVGEQMAEMITTEIEALMARLGPTERDFMVQVARSVLEARVERGSPVTA
jgi:MarR family transcriptional regulator, lower aerobic nicotinate degradation pathway regulator